MARAHGSIRVPGTPDEAEALWYDLRQWPTFVDGLARIEHVRGPWPAAGSEVTWVSWPDGRGRVRERVRSYAPGEGQAVEVADDALEGVQRIGFRSEGPEVTRATLELEFTLRERSALGPLQTFFVRRALEDALGRTLARFGEACRGGWDV